MKNFKFNLTQVELDSLLLSLAFTHCKSETELSQVALGLYKLIEAQSKNGCK